MKKKKDGIVPLFFILFLLVLGSWSFAQEKKYPPYPNVWEREFVDYVARGLMFLPINREEVFIHQFSKVDKNGEPVRNPKGIVIDLWDGLFFFQGGDYQGLQQAQSSKSTTKGR